MKLIGYFYTETPEYLEAVEKAEACNLPPPEVDTEELPFHIKKETIVGFNESRTPDQWRIFTSFGVEFTILKSCIDEKELIEICE